MTGCGSDESGHSHGEGGDHTHGQESQQHASHEQTQSAHAHDGDEDNKHSHEAHGSDGHTHDGQEHAHDSQGSPDTDHIHNGGDDHSHDAQNQHSDAHSHEHEKSGNQLAPDESYDEVQKGIRLTMSYDAESNTFTGQVENSTQDALPPVSVSVQLSNRTTLGPTSPVKLAPGESQSITLEAPDETFDHWRPHSELGSDGHSHGENSDHQH